MLLIDLLCLSIVQNLISKKARCRDSKWYNWLWGKNGVSLISLICGSPLDLVIRSVTKSMIGVELDARVSLLHHTLPLQTVVLAPSACSYPFEWRRHFYSESKFALKKFQSFCCSICSIDLNLHLLRNFSLFSNLSSGPLLNPTWHFFIH